MKQSFELLAQSGIATPTAHQICLKELEALMSLEQRTPAQDEQLSALAAVIEPYEDKHFSLPLHPTDAGKELQCG